MHLFYLSLITVFQLWASDGAEKVSCRDVLETPKETQGGQGGPTGPDRRDTEQFWQAQNPEDEFGLVTTTLPLSPENVIEAYRHGVFPWEDLGDTAGWYSPKTRGVLFFSELHVARTLARLQKKNGFRITFNTAFEQVIRSCMTVPRGPGNEHSWITKKIVTTWVELHSRGIAQSVEVWEGDSLVGGIYGTYVDGVFSAESMFHLVSNAGKIGFLALVDRLKEGGLTWMDTQVVTPTTASFGARSIPREEYLAMLRSQQNVGRRF